MGARATLAAVGLWLGIASVAAASSGTVPASSPGLGRSCTQWFRVLPYLTHVTATAIRINIVPIGVFQARVSLSPASQYAWGVTGTSAIINTVDGTRTHFVAAPNPTFSGLTAGTEYKYQVECRASATAPWQTVSRSYFKTLQTNAAATVRVAMMADSHLYERLANSGLTTIRLNQVRDGLMGLAVHNMQSWGLDFLVDDGDTSMDHCLTCAGFDYVREDGSTYSSGGGSSGDQTEADFRWEAWLAAMQPILQHLPLIEAVGNHEGITDWGGVGAAQLCSQSQDLSGFALNALHNLVGNYNDAYPNGSDGVDYDGDGGIENQTDGLYFEFASGSLRWFVTDSLFYSHDLVGAAAAATLFPGFVARTAAVNGNAYGNSPSANWPLPSGDSYEDDASLGGTQTAWFILRVLAKAEAFGAVISHRVVGGYLSQPACYFYQRGFPMKENYDTDGDGDVEDEKYIADQMAAHAIQLRFVAHDHHHVICRNAAGDHYIEIGQPECNLTDTTFGTCGAPNWLETGATASSLEMQSSYDCDSDGFMDSSPKHILTSADDVRDKRFVQNGGIAGANGTMNKGFGILTVNGNTTMDWKWIVDDDLDPVRNNDPIITYGPITP